MPNYGLVQHWFCDFHGILLTQQSPLSALLEWIRFTLEVFKYQYGCLLVAIKDLRFMKTKAHSLNLTWAPQDFHACYLENITVTAEATDRNQTLTCVVYKENLRNFCIIKGLMPRTTYAVKALSCTYTDVGCISMDGYISAVINPGR